MFVCVCVRVCACVRVCVCVFVCIGGSDLPELCWFTLVCYRTSAPPPGTVKVLPPPLQSRAGGPLVVATSLFRQMRRMRGRG